MDPSDTNSGILARVLGGVAATAVVGSLAGANDNAWFDALDKPAWQPPDRTFPIVWTLLYGDIAAVSITTLGTLEADGHHDEARAYRRALWTNLVLNATWSWVFFRAHRPKVAAVHATVLAASSADLARRAGQRDRHRGLALGAYAAWTAFATVLACAIARRNPDAG